MKIPANREIVQSMTGDRVLIFGKGSCPYTQDARDDYARRKVPFEYIEVEKNPADLQRMLGYSGGRRQVPVIVDGGKVTIGFGGT